MPLKIEITICDRGSVNLYHVGDTRLLVKQYGCIRSMLDDLHDNARLDVNPRRKNVLERFLEPDPIVERVREKLASRSRAGIAKYGKRLTRQDIGFSGWITHLQEELLDGANYCERLLSDWELQQQADANGNGGCDRDQSHP